VARAGAPAALRLPRAPRVRAAAVTRASMAPHGPRPVRAALFDMDGTILDIEPLSTQAINQQCARARGRSCARRVAGALTASAAAAWSRWAATWTRASSG
jgi:hypothetical protein